MCSLINLQDYLKIEDDLICVLGGKGHSMGFDIYLKYKSKQTHPLGSSYKHMQDMSSIDKQKQLLLRRKHKLFKSLAQPSHPPNFHPHTLQKDVINLYERILNKENKIQQINYFIKHQLDNDLTHHMNDMMNLLWSLLDVRSGTLISFVTYRLCRKYPASYWVINDFMEMKANNQQQKSLEQVIFLTEAYLYGFSIPLETFTNFIFPHYEQHILYLLPKYIHVLQSNQFFHHKSQRGFFQLMQAWMDSYKKNIVASRDSLLVKAEQIQQRLILQKPNQSEEQAYISSLQNYQTQLYKFQNALQFLTAQFNCDQFKLKSIFQLKKQCTTFKLSFQFSQYEKQLYLCSGGLRQLKPLKKSQMIRIEQSEAFVRKIKHCSTIDQCVDLAGYFLQQMNIQHNRDQLIEIIINDCFNYNNISYILKVVLQVSRFQPSLYEYCCNKGRKICAQARMNIKYQKLLCEMSRFNLLDQNILLDYSQKILLLENSQVTKEVESILQQLGTIVYYRSLQTHTRINEIFSKIQAIMKNKLVHFNIEQIFHLKGLLSYLRNHSNKISTAQTHQIAQLEIKTNFQFILKKMQKLIKENQAQKIYEFIVAGIDHQDFLSSYYYASLLRDLGHKELNKMLHQYTLTSIGSSLLELNAQRSVCWGRFLGQLYNYQIINRKKLVENLFSFLRSNQSAITFNSCLKSICATLQTAKFYLKDGEQAKDKKQVVYILLELQKIIVSNKDLQKILYDQIAEIMEFFHPHLTELKSLQQIERLINLSNLNYIKFNVYNLLDMMHKGISLDQLQNGQKAQAKKKYQEKEKSQKKWVQKPIKYKQKVEAIANNDEPQSPSKQSTKAQQLQVSVQKKKIKVMGRSRGDKKIKTVTCEYVDQIREP